MSLTLALVVATIVIALFFDFTNGFHDAANAIATSVSTRALTPRLALLMAGMLNFVGALLGVGVANTIAEMLAFSGHMNPSHALTIVASALVGAIVWNLITWYFGIPSSSSHALIGGLVGVGVAAGGVGVHWVKLVDKVAIPMVASPLLGFAGAFAVMTAFQWIFHKSRPDPVNRGFRRAQTLSAAGLSLGHGLQDAQKTMGVIVLALIAGGYHSHNLDIPLWVILAAAGAISLGTFSGGMRIMRTLGRRIFALDPPRAFAAESTAAVVLYAMAIALHAPVSTTHTITTAVMGAGATKRFSAVRWGVARGIVIAWIITIPAAAAVSAGTYGILHLLVPQ